MPICKTPIFSKRPNMKEEDRHVTILLIDDDPDDREFFTIAMGEVERPVKVQIARGCSEAIDMLQETDDLPDFIFLDLNMPVIDGRACLRKLKADAKTHQIPVVIFTTSSHSKDKRETRELGAIDFMTKPADISELTKNINFFLNNQLQKTV